MEIQCSHVVLCVLIPSFRRSFLPGDGGADPPLFQEKRTQGALREIIFSFSRVAEPQLGFFVIRQDAQAIPVSPAQLMGSYNQTVVPQLLQRLQCLSLLRLGGIVIIKPLLPLGNPALHYLLEEFLDVLCPCLHPQR